MLNIFRAACVLGAALSLPLYAADKDRIEEAYETSTDATPLPASINGTITVRTCYNCQPVLMSIDSQARFRIGETKVSFAELAAYTSSARDRSLVIFYDTKQRVVTGVKVSGQVDSRKPRRP
jgi:hypothetical protein